jgi:Protein of unknown function (DUF3604)
MSELVTDLGTDAWKGRAIGAGAAWRALAAAGLALVAAAGCGDHQGPGTIEGAAVPPGVVAKRAGVERVAAQQLAQRAGAERPDRQILFGDLHVHTTYSVDAFMMALPILQGDGVHPIADACDFARYCSGLDFWSITDHAEGITPAHWKETVESIRQCNEIAGDPQNPDLVSFLGWEWTQIGTTPKDHYGHKNVILREVGEGRVPARPIHSASFAARAMRQRQPLYQLITIPLLDWPNREIYLDFARMQREVRDTPPCPEGVDTRELPDDCSEGAPTPEVLFRKLDEWGFDALVIPHGTTWGIYTPQGSSWDKQLTPAQHDPSRQRLVEVYSGHGSSEQYRDWRSVEFDASGAPICPQPRDGYEPCCWRAGEIIRKQCEEPDSADCEARVQEARANFLAAGARGRFTISGADLDDWGNCGTCPDCFLPAMNYRPASSVQYMGALTNFDVPAAPLRFRFGYIASSDNHSARPGTGYKEYARLANTEARGPRSETWYERTFPHAKDPIASVPVESLDLPPWQALDFERQASFFLTGGLVAVHSAGRSRDAIFDALVNRQVYGTSGPRILLWFDLLNAPGGPAPMGSEVKLDANPRFRVRAAGSLEQKPGCPVASLEGLSPERLEQLCRGECYNPGDQRRRITRIEVVRIRPRSKPGEPIRSLIQDPWRTFPCPGSQAGCVVEFEDPEFMAGGREALYYVRAIEEPSLAVNAGELRCATDENGRCVEVSPCYGDYRTPPDEDCLAPTEERAWSSPIYLDPL